MARNFNRLFQTLRRAIPGLAKKHGVVVEKTPDMNSQPPSENIDLNDALKPELARAPKFVGAASEGMALRHMLGQMNTVRTFDGKPPTKEELEANNDVLAAAAVAGRAIPDEVHEIPTAIQPPPLPASVQPRIPIVQAPTVGLVPQVQLPADFTKVFFTGRLAAGKDFCADAASYTKVGMADPIYGIASELTGIEITATKNKDLPGIRALLQKIGQYGRGTVNAEYPWTTERITFLAILKAYRPDLFDRGFGVNDKIWIEMMLERVAPGTRVACTNVRFKNEFDALKEAGFEHWHVMTSPAEWTARLAAKGLNPQSKEVNDVSEQFAMQIDKGFATKFRQQPNGGKMRVVWNSNAPCPARFYTVPDFLARISTAPAQVGFEGVSTPGQTVTDDMLGGD